MAAEPETKQDFSFGSIVVRENLASLEQVKEALDIQAQMRAMGIQPKPLGEILVEKGYIAKEAVDRILSAQKEGFKAQVAAGKVGIPGYEILGKIGAGAMGAVYKARQISMDRMVAIKVLASKYSRDSSFVKRFVNEARAVAKLNHENIMAGIDVGESAGLHYFVMEFVDGAPVVNRIRKLGRIEERECLEIACQMARALEHAHRNRIVHRDIKPENIMITNEGNVAKLCDLGLAKQETGDASLTMEGMSVGTPNYISPEQARGERDIDIRTDIYSLGATLYHMATGSTPFSGPNPMTVMTKHVTDEPEPPKRRNPQLTDSFNALILKMMAKQRERRHQSPSELLADLERIRSFQGSPARKPAAPAHAPAQPPAPSTAARIPPPPPPPPPPPSPASLSETPPAPTRVADSRVADTRPGRIPGRASTTVQPPVRAASASSSAQRPKAKSGGGWGWFFGFVILLLLLGGGAAAVIYRKQWLEEQQKPFTDVPTATPAGATVKTPEEQLQDIFNQMRDAAWKHYETLSGTPADDPIQKGYARFLADQEKFNGTRLEKDWGAETGKFRDAINESVAKQDWTARQAAAIAHRDAGRFGEALKVVRGLPEYMRYFVRNAAKPEESLHTKAGQEQLILERGINQRLDKKYQDDLSAAIKLATAGQHAEAQEIVSKMVEYTGAERVSDVAAAREQVTGREIDSILGSAPSADQLKAAEDRLKRLGEEFPLNQPWAARRAKEAHAKRDAAIESCAAAARLDHAARLGKTFEKLMLARDFPGLRKAFAEHYFGARSEYRSAALLLRPGDAELLKSWLTSKSAQAPDYARIVAACEAGAKEAGLKPELLDGARESYLDLREFALLEDLAHRVLAGVPVALADWKNAQADFSGDLPAGGGFKAVERASADDPFALEASGVRLWIAPRRDRILSVKDVAQFQNRSLGPDWFEVLEKKPAHHALRLLLHCYYTATEQPTAAAVARSLTPEFLFNRYTSLLDFSSPKDEREAERLYGEAMKLIVAGKKAEAVPILRELQKTYKGTKFIRGAEPNGTPRITVIENLLKDEQGGMAPAKPATLAALLQADKVREPGKLAFEATYDFRGGKGAGDFERAPLPLDPDRGSVEVRDGEVEALESGLWLWKPVLRGDVTVTWSVKARAERNLGFVVDGNAAGSEGYVCWLAGRVPGADEEKRNFNQYRNPIWQLPATLETLKSSPALVHYGADRDPAWTLREGGIYEVVVVRKGRTIEVKVNGKPVAFAESATKWTAGRIGLALWDSRAVVDSVKISGTLDAAWAAANLSAGK